MYVKPTDIIKEGEKTTTLLFPNRVVVNLGGSMVDYSPGIHEVPESLTNVKHPVTGKDTGLHWYLKANKVEVYTRPQYPPAKPLVATEDHQRFMDVVGVPNIKSLADAQKFLDGLSPSEKAGFLSDFDIFMKTPPAKTEEETSDDGKKTPVDLSTFKTKADLAAHANEVHGLELDPKEHTREELEKAIQEAAAKKTE